MSLIPSPHSVALTKVPKRRSTKRTTTTKGTKKPSTKAAPALRVAEHQDVSVVPSAVALSLAASSQTVSSPTALDKHSLKPNSYYSARFCGYAEIILTTTSGTFFYIHGDEYARPVSHAGLEVKSYVAERPAK
jgi:hypothetical protein